ncbi:uncharacterized protein LOC115925437 [Strongylocentrotus purpuratus]|uniref:Integrase catalytic domain-containing protein n=1 Tax=Strongylocentrotus purpuratus TaxID=7668 RepID=A0A7M7P4M4_STRPU|nr:uncharacterized protein LOC115925437 [Strongylocentrotus purpuratus]
MSQVGVDDVNPEDSASQVGKSSTTSSGLRTRAKRAAIAAELAVLQEEQEIELEEIRLKQRKAKLLLRAKLSAAEAEEDVYEQHRSGSKVSSIGNRSSSQQNVKQVHESAEHATEHHHHVSNHDVKEPALLQETIPFPAQQMASSPISGQAYQPRDDREFYLQTQVQQQRWLEAISLANVEMMKFDGSPLHFHEFMMSFDNLIGRSSLDSGTKLMKLYHCCEGEVKGIIQCCMVMEPLYGYQRARELLVERFGSKYKIGEAWIKRITTGPICHANDRKGLQKFADELKISMETLRAMDLLQEISSQRELLKVAERLPYYLKGRWLKLVRDIRQQERSPDISDMARFVSNAAEEANDPVFGDLTATTKRVETSNPAFNKKSTRSNYMYATEVTEVAVNLKCLKCRQEHSLFGCDSFKSMAPEMRFQFAQDNRLCFNCLQSGHTSRFCRLNRRCSVQGCQRKHTKFLHFAQDASSSAGRMTTTQAPVETQNNEVHQVQNGFVKKCVTGAGRCVLPIVPVRVRAQGENVFVNTYALLDSGSTSTFCTATLARELNATGRKQSLSLTTLEKRNSPIETSVISLIADTGPDTDCVKLPCVYTRDAINIRDTHIANVDDISGYHHLEGINLPIIERHEVGLLIGQDSPEALIPIEVRRGQHGPYAVRTKLGWSVSGPVGSSSDGVPKATSSFIDSNDRLEEQVSQFWKIEATDVLKKDKAVSVNDKKVMEIWERDIQREGAHFQLPVPFRRRPPNLPDNKWSAEQRLKSLARRLQRDQAMYVKYKQGIEDLLRKGYAEEVSEETRQPKDTPVWYLPHHPVLNPQKPDKMRIVFDCAAKHQGVSLNDAVLQGPDLINNLMGVLLRFRQQPVALMSDIEAMFHQVRVPPEDRDVLRFLWWKDGDFNKEPLVYRMCVHLFGGTWSPSVCSHALRQTARNGDGNGKVEASKAILENFYVDDCLVSVENEETAVKLAADLMVLLSEGGFRLTKWVSNNPFVLQSIPEEERAKDVRGLDLNHDALPVERALGISWDVETDCLLYKFRPKDKPQTRRGILSVVSSIYDPLGYASPFILKAKMILQELTRLKLAWDEEIPSKEIERWNEWLQELPKMTEFQVNRCIKPHDFGKVAEYKLHHFADASEKAYGVVSYLRMKDVEGQVHCSILFARSRLAPLKRMTIPRLELMAATLSVTIDSMIQRELDLPLQESVFWTDSSIVLHYVKNEDKRFHTFVANRITTIHEGSEPRQWRHVNTDVNPADDASRGLTAEELTGRWKEGPKFLWSEECDWPKSLTVNESSLEHDPEVKQDKTGVFAAAESEVKATDRLLESYSSWFRLKKGIAWILKVKECLRRKARKDMNLLDMKQPVTVDEMTVAEEAIVRYVQQQTYAEEYRVLQQNKTAQRSPTRIAKSSPLSKLSVKLTDEGLICVGGRLHNAPLEEQTKHPVILPSKHHVVQLLVRHYHIMCGHSGKEYVLSLLRQRFWIIRGRLAVRHVLHKCFTCKRQRAKPVEQKMADLPADRVVPEKPPFSNVGVDCFGPYMVRQGRSSVKRYGCIFTCLVIRAIHIEVLHSLETDSFLNALQRFISRRGQPEIIRSDNGTNFIGAERELREGLKRWNQEKIHDNLLQQGIDWKFNPPRASHMGGSWERQIRTTRKVLNAVMKQQVLNDEGLTTLMCLVEAIINGRPLTITSDDARDAEPLTPNHLLLLRSKNALPPDVFQKHDLYGRRRWRQIQYLADLFWRRWVKEYLPSLQQRQKWLKETRNLEEGDIVLIIDNLPRNKWLTGRVIETYPGKDKLVRSVKLKHSTGILVRPVQKLCLLEEADSVLVNHSD